MVGAAMHGRSIQVWSLAAALLAMAGCVSPAQRVGAVDSGWRTRSGQELSVAEAEALRQSCTPGRGVTLVDPDRPVPDPLRDNPAYHPGGEGLANAPATGIAAADRPIQSDTRQVEGSVNSASLDNCLYEKGLVRVR